MLLLKVCTLLTIFLAIQAQPDSGYLGTKVKNVSGIPGPRSYDDRIAIVGAGPSGIHMAFRLKELGFRNVEILERENRIGGRVFDVLHRGTVQQLTFFAILPDYNELMRLIREYSDGRLLIPPSNSGNFFDLTRRLYPKYTRGKSDAELKMALVKELIRYTKLHKRLFGKYHPFLMPRPNARVRRAIRGTATDFLRRNKMPLIDTVAMYIYLTRGGYQQPHRVSAIYGLMWITPKVCKAFIDENVPVVTFIDSGLISLFETLIRRFNINIKLNTNIKRIRRFINSPNGNIEIQYSNRKDPLKTFSKYYDFIVVSSPMRDLLNIIDASHTERIIFRRQITDTYFISSLIDSPYGVRSDRPNDAYPETLLQYDFEPYAAIDIFSMTQNFTGEKYKNGLTPGGFDGKRIQSSVYYQLGRLNPRNPFVMRVADDKLRRHMRQKHRIPYNIVARLITPYFTRFSVSDMDKGIIWDVFDLQGHRNTWYIGGSVTFDSAGAVIQYNNKLLRHYNLPYRGDSAS